MKKVKFSFFKFFVSIIILGLFSKSFSSNALAQFSSFKFETRNNNGINRDIICSIYSDSLIIGVIPSQIKDVNLIASFSSNSGNKIFIDDVEQKSEITINDFSKPLYYSVFSGNKLVVRYKVEIVNTGLPVVYINTEDQAPVVSKETYVNGDISIYPIDESPVFSAPMQIKARGNFTWSLPKKPYKVKLQSKASILGMPSDKEWVLLANYTDKTLIRNTLAFDMSSKMNLAYTPRMFAVDLIFNGRYDGSYLLGEQIKVAKNRVNIKELEDDDNDESVVSGGYLFEINERLDEVTSLVTNRGVPITFKSPEIATLQQYTYIRNYLQEMEDVLYSDAFNSENGYKKYLNPESFIDWYWINELFKNKDAQNFSSIFLFKDRNGKVNMGPIWDFDLGIGNIDFDSCGCTYPNGWWVKEGVWMKRLFDDPAFKTLAFNRWKELKKDVIPYLVNQITNRSNEILKSQRLNFYRWPIMDQYVFPNAVVTGSYEKELDYLQVWLEARIQWIDDQVDLVPAPGAKFTQVSPVDNESIIISPSSENALTFKWTDSENWSMYKLLLDTAGGNFQNPLLEIKSDSYGFATTTSLSSASIVELFNRLGIMEEESVNLKWIVKAYNSNDVAVRSDKSFNLKLKNGIIAGDYVSKFNSIKLYPNPTSGLLTIESGSKFEIAQVELYDLMGQKIEDMNFQNNSDAVHVDLGKYSKGTYLVYLKSSGGERFIQRVVIY